MTFDVVTLFPGTFFGALGDGVLARARRAGTLSVRVHDLRRWGIGPHRQVDDGAFGGGGGMVLRPEPLFDAVDWLRARFPSPSERVVLLSPRGTPLGHRSARRLAGYERVVLLCGRYEGVDERVHDALAHEAVSIGDYVLTGGEVPALVVIDAVSRFVPGVLGKSEAASSDSFADGRLEHPHFTRPAVYRGMRVPEVLLSGDHGAIASWRKERSVAATRERRPDLIEDDSARKRAPGGAGSEGSDG